MNEITRIHIAKVAYDVEVAAKKQLEKYIKSLETYTRDAEVLADIEIRMTELLAERGVKAGGVISTEDVAAIREQLGEPYEFADEDGDIAVGAVDTSDVRKFYRNMDDAVLGGVLSGIATYFKVNPLWPRLIFILLTFISFGSSLLAYILLWIIVPPARTATQKLRQAGRSVTLDSIRELNESNEMARSSSIAPTVRRVFSILLGMVNGLSAIVTISITAFLVIGAFGLNGIQMSERFSLSGADGATTFTAWVVYGIVMAGLVLLAALFSLAAYAFFAQKLTKRMVIAGIVIIALGLTSFVASIGIVSTQAWRISSEAQSLVKETKASLPKEFANVHSITVDEMRVKGEVATYVGAPSIQYIVDEGIPRYELSALPNVTPTITVDGESAHITLSVPNDYRNTFVHARLVIYGPALTKLTSNAANVSYTAASQPALDIVAEKASRLTVNAGDIAAVTVSGLGRVDLGAASVASLSVKAGQSLSVSAGTVRELRVSQPDVCPIGSGAESSVTVSAVTSGRMTYNDTDRRALSYRTNCAEVVVGETHDSI